jgi:hypothetical protein
MGSSPIWPTTRLLSLERFSGVHKRSYRQEKLRSKVEVIAGTERVTSYSACPSNQARSAAASCRDFQEHSTHAERLHRIHVWTSQIATDSAIRSQRFDPSLRNDVCRLQ